MHHPSLNKFTLLSSVATVDYGVSLQHELLHHGKLLFNMFSMYEFYAESLWNHGQSAEAPRLPCLGIVMRFLQRTEVTVSPCHLVSVAFHISVFGSCGSNDACYFPCHARFLSNANNHQ